MGHESTIHDVARRVPGAGQAPLEHSPERRAPEHEERPVPVRTTRRER
jgi:hypothetical protein